MKWNTCNVSVIVIILSLGSFILGKLTSGKAELTGRERLLEDSKYLISQHSHHARSVVTNRDDTSRPNRPTQQRGATSLDQKLDNMEQIVRGENVLERSRAMLEWIDKLAPEEFEDAVQRFQDLDLTRMHQGEYNMLLTAWTEIDPISALAHTTVESSFGGFVNETVLSTWANRDPEPAIAWAKAKYEGDGANPYMVEIIRGVVESNPSLATSLLEEIPQSFVRREAISAMMPHMLKMGLETAQDWIAGLSDANLRREVGAHFLESGSKQDPARAAAWLLANQETQSASSFHHVFQEWAKKDFDAATSSFEKLPEGINRSNALQGMIKAEATANPHAVAELMNRYPRDLTDDTVVGFVHYSKENATDIAASQIALIQDEPRRNQMYEYILNPWLERDQAGAQNWINSANLPAKVIDSLKNR